MAHPFRRLSPITVYLVLEFAAALFFSLIFTVNLIYHVTVVGLSPLQLVLVGTILEATAFAFEIPTGILADVKSRKLSIIIGYLLTGVAFVVEGSFATFAAVALSQVIWGIGYTFTSGATQAWIADEVGEDRVGPAFMRGSQAARAGGLLAIPLSVVVGIINVRLPIVIGGLLFLALAGFLALAMGEEGFRPAPPGERSTWRMMAGTVGDARRLVARQPVLLALRGCADAPGLFGHGPEQTPARAVAFGCGQRGVGQALALVEVALGAGEPQHAVEPFGPDRLQLGQRVGAQVGRERLCDARGGGDA